MRRCLLLALLLLWPAWGQATVLFQEDWEGTPASITATWADTNCANGSFPLTSDPSLSTDRAWSGTHSIKFVYNGHQQDHINAGFTGPGTLGLNLINVPCTTTSAYFTPTQEIWLTWYEYLVSGFQFDEISTKEWYVYGSTAFGNQVGGWPNLYNTFGNGANSPATGSPLGLSFQGVFDSSGSPWGTYSLQGNVTTVYDKWICYEEHYKMNDVGLANGVLQIYVTNVTDGGATVLSLDTQNHQWRGTNTTDPWPSNSIWGSIKLFVQDAIGVMYRDAITVTTTRQGCGTAPPPLPTVTNVVTTQTTEIITGTQHAGDPAAAMRVCPFTPLNPQPPCTVYPISQVVGWPASGSCSACQGTLTLVWPVNTTSACTHAQDAAGSEDPVNYTCTTVHLHVAPGPPTSLSVQ